MSEIKHTPAPWTFQFDGDGGDFFIKSETTGETIVAGGLSRDFELDGREHQQLKATVRVMTAAPELLEALEFALHELEAYCFDESGEHYNSPLINAAIAKAEGKS